jgi:hypothetical protein
MRLKISILAAALVALTLAWGGALNASESHIDLQDGFIEPVQACCNCDPRASDMQCFAECNAMLPRCRPPAPRAPTQAARGPMVGVCCYGMERAGLSRRAPLGTLCTMPFYDHAVRETKWVTGRACE